MYRFPWRWQLTNVVSPTLFTPLPISAFLIIHTPVMGEDLLKFSVSYTVHVLRLMNLRTNILHMVGNSFIWNTKCSSAMPLNQLSGGFKRLYVRVQSNYFLAHKICVAIEKYAAAVVDYQILDQKLTGPPVTTLSDIKFGQIFKWVITPWLL